MQELVKALSRIKGIGAVLAGRLIEAGLDGYEKVASASPEELGRIRGMNPKAVPGILAQAAALAAPHPEPSEEKELGVRQAAEQLRRKVASLAASVHARFAGDEPGRGAKKMEKQILKLVDLLDRIEAAPERRPKRTRRRLAKADRRLSCAEEKSPAELARGLKKTRRKLRKAIE